MSQFYANPSYMIGGNYIVYSGSRRQRGGSLIVYSGSRRQRGGSLFSSFKSGVGRGAKFAGAQMIKGAKFAGRNIASGVKYTGKNIASGVKKAAKNEVVREIAKQAAQKGTEIAASAAIDALQGRNIGEALKERSREAVIKTLTGESNTNQPRRRKRIKKLKQNGNTAKKRRLNNTPTSVTRTSTKVIGVRRRRKKKSAYTKKGRFSRAAANRNNLF